MDELLEGGRVLWSERPYNQPKWSKYVGDDGVGRIFYYDENTKHGYAGCCDLIYMDNNAEIVLADFKTSAGPYSARFPNKKSNVDEKTKKALISGVFKVKKTRLQLAAYKLAAEACLGIKINKTQIIVSTPIEDYQTQVFTFGETEVEKDELAWLALVDVPGNVLACRLANLPRFGRRTTMAMAFPLNFCTMSSTSPRPSSARRARAWMPTRVWKGACGSWRTRRSASPSATRRRSRRSSRTRTRSSSGG